MINLNNSDFYNGFKKKHVWFNIAKTEIKFKFKRTKLGPLWITIGTAIFIVVLSIITGAFFADDIDVRVPYITTRTCYLVFNISLAYKRKLRSFRVGEWG